MIGLVCCFESFYSHERDNDEWRGEAGCLFLSLFILGKGRGSVGSIFSSGTLTFTLKDFGSKS